MNKVIKCGLTTVVFVIVLINSINIKDLDKVRTKKESGNFEAGACAQNFWEQQRTVSIEEAVNLSQLLTRLEQSFDSTAARGQQVGISDYRYFMVQGSGTIEGISEDDVVVVLDKGRKIRLATGFIFGNTMRNAVSQIDIGEFMNMTQFNEVSIQINNLVQENIVPILEERAETGRSVSFAGALSIDVETRQLDSLRIIPLQIDIEEEK
ncbi:MAG TPA: DUF2291 family protein [Fodinibius sp.]|nr:DUF2291 family protein [Fodinibius sp.]